MNSFLSKKYKNDNKPFEKIAPKHVSKAENSPVKELEEEGNNLKKPSIKDIAKYFLIIGSENASGVMNYLEEEEIALISKEIMKVSNITEDEKVAVMKKFKYLFSNLKPSGSKTFLKSTVGDQKTDEIYSQISEKEDFFKKISNIDYEYIYVALKDEDIFTKALVIANIEPKVSANLIKKYSPDEQRKIIKRISNAKSIPQNINMEVSLRLYKKIEQYKNNKLINLDGKDTLANILKNMSDIDGKNILNSLSDEDPKGVEALKHKVYDLEVILEMDNRELQNILLGYDDYQLAVLLKGKSDSVKEKILNNVSDNRRKIILSDYEELGSMNVREVNVITNDFIKFIRTLAII